MQLINFYTEEKLQEYWSDLILEVTLTSLSVYLKRGRKFISDYY